MMSLKLLRVVVVVTYPRGGGLWFMGGAFLSWKLLDFLKASGIYEGLSNSSAVNEV